MSRRGGVKAWNRYCRAKPSQTGSRTAEVLSSAMPSMCRGAANNPGANEWLQGVLCIQRLSLTYREKRSLTTIHR